MNRNLLATCVVLVMMSAGWRSQPALALPAQRPPEAAPTPCVVMDSFALVQEVRRLARANFLPPPAVPQSVPANGSFLDLQPAPTGHNPCHETLSMWVNPRVSPCCHIVRRCHADRRLLTRKLSKRTNRCRQTFRTELVNAAECVNGQLVSRPYFLTLENSCNLT